MNQMRCTPFLLLLVLLTAVLAACGGTETETVTVEVTRIVTETVEVEGEVIEVTRITAEEAVEEAEEAVEEETAAEEPAAPLEEADADDLSAIGSEDDTGDGPPPPDTGPKVEGTRSSTETAALAPDSELRSAEEAGTGETTVVPDPTAQNSQLTAGEVDDNAQWDDYLRYLQTYAGAAVIEVDVSERHQITVQDGQGNPVLGARIEIEANGAPVMTLRTHSNGRALFFPRALSSTQRAESYLARIVVNRQETSIVIPDGSTQREWIVTHPAAGAQPDIPRLDVLFLIDATGSMSDEINQLKENIRAISTQINALPSQPDVRFGMVTYRDRNEAYLVNVTDFTPNIDAFATALAQVEAAGGGDYPEDLNEALATAVREPEWRIENSVSLIFLVADAPPHLDYEQTNHYAVEMLAATERGIKIYPIASSGLDAQGEYIFRQLAQVTSGRFIFLTYGPTGPGSSGTETNFAVSDYTVSALDQLVVQIVEEELAFLNR